MLNFELQNFVSPKIPFSVVRDYVKRVAYGKNARFGNKVLKYLYFIISCSTGCLKSKFTNTTVAIIDQNHANLIFLSQGHRSF